jgi:hypothetical protein
MPWFLTDEKDYYLQMVTALYPNASSGIPATARLRRDVVTGYLFAFANTSQLLNVAMQRVKRDPMVDTLCFRQ